MPEKLKSALTISGFINISQVRSKLSLLKLHDKQINSL